MGEFKLVSPFKPTGDQPQAIEKLSAGVGAGLKNQVLLGVTGSGKTFTMANIIARLRMPALIVSHNKTLAGQLYQEMRDFFPENAASYFVSYYDYYQPEAYLPATDTYIEKEAQINELIDKLRLKSTTNILTRPDAVVVASVSCIYNIGSPLEYGNYVAELSVGDAADFEKLARRLAELQYERSEFEFRRGTFRLRGNHMDIYPSYEDYAVRVRRDGSAGSPRGKISKLAAIDPISGAELPTPNFKLQTSLLIYPAKHYLTDPGTFGAAEVRIRSDLTSEHAALLAAGRRTEAERLNRKVNYDLEMIKEVGYVSGIENYSRYFDGRAPGEPPHTLLDYFVHAYGKRFLVFIDESHMTVPQLRGMYNGDAARKKILVEFGFRLKAAFDNRPLKFDEFYQIPPHFIYASATPDEWEVGVAVGEAQRVKSKIHGGVVEQLVRPTGIVDPEILVRPVSASPNGAREGEIQDLLREISARAGRGERTLVTTLTKKTAEELTEYLKDKGVRAAYLHSDIETLERSDVLDNLRKNEFDALVGVNLLREGLDLPEVTLVAILDADKEGFLRSRTSLIQTMGRAARNVAGVVILYADEVTGSMKNAMEEIARRRARQVAYNKAHRITPATVAKPIREKIIEREALPAAYDNDSAKYDEKILADIKPDALTPYDRKKVIKRLEREMKRHAEDFNFELAIKIRDKIKELKKAAS